MIKACSNCKGI